MFGFLERKDKQKKRPTLQKGSEGHLEMKEVVWECGAHGVQRKVSQETAC